jgi:hypothetical protein
MTPTELSAKIVSEYVDLDRFLQDQGIKPGNTQYERRPLLERVKELVQRTIDTEREEWTSYAIRGPE